MRVRMTDKEQVKLFPNLLLRNASSGLPTIPDTWNKSCCFTGPVGKCSQDTQVCSLLTVVSICGGDFIWHRLHLKCWWSNLPSAQCESTAPSLEESGSCCRMCCTQQHEGCSGLCPIPIPAWPQTDPVFWDRNCGITSAIFPTDLPAKSHIYLFILTAHTK